MSLVLLEGPDGGGKTTLAKQLTEYTYVHNGPPPRGASPAETFWWQLQSLMAPHKQQNISASAWYNGPVTNWVVDRSWPSDQIYHRFTGRPNVFHPYAQRMFERYMFANEGVVVLCLPSFATAYRTWSVRAEQGLELIKDEHDFATMYYFYKSWARTTSLPVVIYDYERNDVEWLRSALSFHRQHIPRDNKALGIVYGNPAAKILIVGEQYNVKARPQGPHIPFVGTGRNGFWLSQQLELMGLTERDLAWVNACQPDGSTTKRADVLRAMPGLRVAVALGSIAGEWVRNSTFIKHWINVPHPAYWARFRAYKPWPLLEHRMYLQEVAECMTQ
jgi:hypothetical protein